MMFVVISLLILAIVQAIIAVHEVGHFVAGLMMGIPWREMSVRLLTFPQHVAVRDGDEWCSPVTDMPRYIELTSRYLTTETAAFVYVAGGLVGESVVTTVVTLLAVQLGWNFLAFWLPVMSLTVYLMNLVLMDVPWAIVFGHPRGDTSGLWSIARAPAVGLTAVLLALRAALIWYVLSRQS